MAVADSPFPPTKMKRQSPTFVYLNSNHESQNLKTYSNYNWSDVKIDLENWMGNLPPFLKKVPLIYIAIPGSHNSFSYSLTPTSGVSPDSPTIVQCLGRWCKPITNRFIFKWSRGQKQNVIQQLMEGIRYFDIRLVVKDKEILIAHGLYGGLILGFLEDINSFLDCHPKEVVVLDFQHFYDFQGEHHSRVLSMIIDTFLCKLCLRHRKMRENSLQKLYDLKNQVIVIYRHHFMRFNEVLWPSSTWPTPWPNKIKVRDLLESLDRGLRNRKQHTGYVTQGVLTPTPKYIATHALGSLKTLASSTNKKLIEWLEGQTNGVKGINVVIVDFVEKCDFAEKVILLNYKPVENSQKHFNQVDEYQEGCD